MFGFINKMFIWLLSTCTTAILGEFVASFSEGHVKCISFKQFTVSR